MLQVTKRRKLAEQILRLINGGDVSKDSQWDIREIELFVEQVSSKLIKVGLFDNYKIESEFNPGSYLVTFTDVPIKRDLNREVSYFDIPADYLNLPGNRGVFSVRAQGVDKSYIPLPPGYENFARIKSAPTLQGNTGYRIEGKKGYFLEDLYQEGLEYLTVQLITGSSGTQDINVPADMEFDIIREVLTLMGAINVLEDKINDENAANR